jgi:hypothetical protein
VNSRPLSLCEYTSSHESISIRAHVLIFLSIEPRLGGLAPAPFGG